MRSNSRFSFTFVLCCLILLSIGLFTVDVKAQQCTAHGLQGPALTWKQNARVKVNIDPTGFNTQALRDAVKAAFDNYNANRSNVGNCSGVLFTPIEFKATPLTGVNTVQVNRIAPSGGAQGEEQPFSSGGNRTRLLMVAILMVRLIVVT